MAKTPKDIKEYCPELKSLTRNPYWLWHQTVRRTISTYQVGVYVTMFPIVLSKVIWDDIRAHKREQKAKKKVEK